ncbi:DNA adenine methylase [Clostridium baratii]|uniref:DNA adenine methylase n=1 Tax=Clostridium baratii TaxID=1561 RepID=UPI0030D1990A
MKNCLVQPFLKWAGGKRQLMNEIKENLPKDIKELKYYEPFIGGGAVFLEIEPKRAIINDFNDELINVYKVIRDNVDELIELLKKHKENNSQEYFYEIRELDRKFEIYDKMSDVEKAARIIYLNKTCYNGLFRVNSKGEFNTPYGKYKNPNIVNEVVLRAVSNYLNSSKKIKIMSGDYKECLKRIPGDSFVYFDPPYWKVSDSSSFTGYTMNGFTKENQIELRDTCRMLHKKGIKFMLSNSDTPFIRDLYKEFKIISVDATRSINSNSKKRGNVGEVLVKNYE